MCTEIFPNMVAAVLMGDVLFVGTYSQGRKRKGVGQEPDKNRC